MAIGTGDAIEKFGTQTAITNAGVSISSGAMSNQAATIAWTNSDDAPEADILLEATFAGAPGANKSVNIYARKLNVRATNDENQPILSDNEAHYLGALVIHATATAQVKTQRVELRNGKINQEYEFYFKNATNSNISSCQAWITPIAVGPAA